MTNSIANWWPAIVFGWPAILAAISLAALGIVSKKPAALFVSALLAAPFSLYLGGTPTFGVLGFMIPILLVGAGVSVRFHRVPAAWLLLAPVLAVVGWLAIIVLGDG